MSDNEKKIDYYPIMDKQPRESEWQRPYLQLPLYSEPPEEYIRQKQEEAEEENHRGVIIIDL
tara:strand:- start:865 stop:1050 length:186 start_codon:yes stop_codon:yes gene_type:complete